MRNYSQASISLISFVVVVALLFTVLDASTPTQHDTNMSHISFIPFVMNTKSSTNGNLLCMSEQEPITVPAHITYADDIVSNDNKRMKQSLNRMIHKIEWNVPIIDNPNAQHDQPPQNMSLILTHAKNDESFSMMGSNIHLYSLVQIKSEYNCKNGECSILWISDAYFACQISLDENNAWLSIYTSPSLKNHHDSTRVIDEALRMCPLVHQSPECNQNEMVLKLSL